MLCARHGPWIAAFEPLGAGRDDLLGFESSGVLKDRLFHHRMFGLWLLDRVLRLIFVRRWSPQ